jgi:transposase
VETDGAAPERTGAIVLLTASSAWGRNVRAAISLLHDASKKPGIDGSLNPHRSDARGRQTLSKYPRLRSTRLHDMLLARGFKGSVRTLRDFVAGVRPRPAREAYLRTDPLIGEQAQVDWAHVGDVDVRGGHRKLWLFVLVLSWSRALWGEFVFDLTVYSLLRSMLRAAIHFGGNCRQWLFDNREDVCGLATRGASKRPRWSLGP